MGKGRQAVPIMFAPIPAGKNNVENRGQNGFSPTAAKNNSVPSDRIPRARSVPCFQKTEVRMETIEDWRTSGWRWT